jgi:anti-sigma regulatory factor (Ser/Thr protein kinase)
MQLTARVRSVLDAGTAPSLMSLRPAAALLITMTLIHVLGSIDIGLRALPLRIPLAAASMVPFFLLVRSAHVIAQRLPRIRVKLVLVAYALGGALRGAILDSGLAQANIVDFRAPEFRVPAGLILTTGTALLISYVWATFQRARDVIASLNRETQSLREAVIELQERSSAQYASETQGMSDAIVSELTQLSQSESGRSHLALQTLVDQVVRPLSHEYAKQVDRWTPADGQSPGATFREVWRSLEPLRHLPPPSLAVALVTLTTVTSSISVFGVPLTAQMLVMVSLSLAISMKIGYRLLGHLPTAVPIVLRHMSIVAAFVLMAIPPAVMSTIPIRNTDRPDAFVLSALIMVPLLGWIVMIGRSAWQHAQDITDHLEATREELSWAMARINLLSWHHRGYTSRLLHGPIQNTIQVGIMRIRGADDDSMHEPIISEIVNRIRGVISDGLMVREIAKQELKAVDDVVTTWGSVAEVSLAMEPQCRESLLHDSIAAGIVADLIQECCSNAIRHGQARRLDIALTLAHRVLVMQVADNGVQDRDRRSRGLGTQLFEECTITQTKTYEEGRNVLTMTIPLVPVPSEALA